MLQPKEPLRPTGLRPKGVSTQSLQPRFSMASLWPEPPRKGLFPWVFHKEHTALAKVKNEKASHCLSTGDQPNKREREQKATFNYFLRVPTTSTHAFPEFGAAVAFSTLRISSYMITAWFFAPSPKFL